MRQSIQGLSLIESPILVYAPYPIFFVPHIELVRILLLRRPLALLILSGLIEELPLLCIFLALEFFFEFFKHP